MEIHTEPRTPLPLRDPGLTNSFGSSFQTSSRLDLQPLGLVNARPTRNLYRQHARRIGRYHDIDGLGLLPDTSFDPPMPWKDGDPPIDPDQAQKLFNQVYASAVEDEERLIASHEHLSFEERQEQALADRRLWKQRIAMAELALKHRVMVFEEYHREEQARLMQRMREGFEILPPPAPAQWLKRRPSSSTTFDLDSATIDKDSLDPRLVTASMEGVLARYQGQLDHLLGQKQRVEAELSSSLMYHQEDFFRTPAPMEMRPLPRAITPERQLTGVNEEGDYHSGRRRSSLSTRPLPYVSPRQVRRTEDQPSEPMMIVYQPTGVAELYAGSQPLHQRGLMASAPPSARVQYAGKENQKIGQVPLQTPGDSEKKPGRNKRAKKVEPEWMQDLRDSNLPTSVISPEAWAAGRQWREANEEMKKKEAETGFKPTRRRRRGKPLIDERVGYPLSDEIADHLLSNGYVKQRPAEEGLAQPPAHGTGSHGFQPLAPAAAQPSSSSGMAGKTGDTTEEEEDALGDLSNLKDDMTFLKKMAACVDMASSSPANQVGTLTKRKATNLTTATKRLRPSNDDSLPANLLPKADGGSTTTPARRPVKNTAESGPPRNVRRSARQLANNTDKQRDSGGIEEPK
ncbi:MAG: hypothetical protein M1817_001468 [Caeruleum heppii]|nr:MAG: hypothetical protein M1817_001468 [Caeruleum heppii]